MTDIPEKPFVPDAFTPPSGLDHDAFRLRPLGPQHNESDYAAWTSSMEHILATPGYEGSSWPRAMTLDENMGDLTKHAGEFVARSAFVYTVLAPDCETVIGCLYIYPSEKPGWTPRSAPGSGPQTRTSTRSCIGWSRIGSPRRGRSAASSTRCGRAHERPGYVT